MDKVIFLDVDGVLNNGKWAMKMYEEEGISVYRENILNEHALRLLKVIVDNTNAKIVVSSAWRQIPECMSALRAQLKNYGMEIYDQTPYVGGIRGDDITAWLNRHPGEYRYVILDDDTDMGEHMSHLVNTCFDEGLKRYHVDRCIGELNAL